MSWRRQIMIALISVVAMPTAVFAQAAGQAPVSGTPASQSAPAVDLLKPEQLEALVAPIALYPDELLANVLAAASYPLELVQADRWVKERKSLKGDALKAAVEKQAWDDSVKALVSTPDVLAMMSDKIDWSKGLGDAVLAQQPDVMDAIQRLRSKAYDNKKLVTTKQQKVSVKTQESRQVVVIEQADPSSVYVPYYDPATVYGAWPYADYPPYYFGYPSYIGAGVVAAGIAFGTPGRSAAGAIIGAAAATGATATSTSIIARPTSQAAGSIMRPIAAVCATTTSMFSSVSATTI
jgi:hypothetical protein